MPSLRHERVRRTLLGLVATAGFPVGADARMLQLRPSDGIGGFAKEFHVAIGTSMAGLRFTTDDGGGVFAEVTLAPGPALAGRPPQRTAQNVHGPSAPGVVSVLWSESVVALEPVYHAIVRMPLGSADGAPRIGAVPAAAPTGSYVVGETGTAPMAVVADLDIQLVIGAAAKALEDGTPGGTRVAGTNSDRCIQLTVLDAPSNGAGASFQLMVPTTSRVTATLHDVRGRLVQVLIPQSVLVAGSHRLVWDGRNTAGREAAGGFYFARVASECAQVARKVLVR